MPKEKTMHTRFKTVAPLDREVPHEEGDEIVFNAAITLNTASGAHTITIPKWLFDQQLLEEHPGLKYQFRIKKLWVRPPKPTLPVKIE